MEISFLLTLWPTNTMELQFALGKYIPLRGNEGLVPCFVGFVLAALEVY